MKKSSIGMALTLVASAMLSFGCASKPAAPAETSSVSVPETAVTAEPVAEPVAPTDTVSEAEPATADEAAAEETEAEAASDAPAEAAEPEAAAAE